MFHSAYHALDWAYNIEGRVIVKMSAINHMRQEPSKGLKNDLLIDLNAYDCHGQAALIIGMVDRLGDPAAREYIRARFGRELGQDDLTIMVYRGCEAAGFGLGGREAVYRIMKSYFSGKVGYRAVKQLLGCRDQYAIMVKTCLYDVLDVIHDRAMADIAEVFRDHGLIREAVASY